MSENKAVKGYKVFKPDWTCWGGFQYEVGKCYEMDERPVVCERGFHFCEELKDCYKYYRFNSDNKVAEITAYGEIDVDEEERKSCTNKIKIERKIDWNEVLAIVNTGKGCTGLDNNGDFNRGNYNNGNRNAGNRNVGNYNKGDNNTGSYNSGNKNDGDCNSGNSNRGNRNSGDDNGGNCNRGDSNYGNGNNGNYNRGDYNRGNNNEGDRNSGDSNEGNGNSGNNNEGNYNRGDSNRGNSNNGDSNRGEHNEGNYNRGDSNRGNRNRGNNNRGDSNNGDDNRGDYNKGNYNNGDYNVGNFNSGCFNTKTTKMFLFNQLSNWTLEDWHNSEAKKILDIYVFVLPAEKTKEEIFEEQQRNWGKLSQKEKDIVISIPNFDKAIFKEVTGIDVDRE